MNVSEAARIIVETIDQAHAKALHQLDERKQQLEKEYQAARQKAADLTAFVGRFTGVNGTAKAAAEPTPAASTPSTPSVKSTSSPRRRIRSKKKRPVPKPRSAAAAASPNPSPPAPHPASAGASTPAPAAPATPASPQRSVRQQVFDQIADWASTITIAKATGFSGKKIRGVLSAKDLQNKIERRTPDCGTTVYKAVR